MLLWTAAAIIDWAIVVMAMAAAVHWTNIFVIALAILVVGNRQQAIAVLGHEGAHGNIGIGINEPLARLCFWPLGIGLSGYRYFHLSHHRFLGSERDPEVQLKRRLNGRYDKMPSTFWIIWFFLLDLIGMTSVPEVLLTNIPFLWAKGRSESKYISFVWGIFLGLAILHPWFRLVFLIWVWSLFTSNWAFNRLRIWREHINTDGVLDSPVPWWGFLWHLPHGIGHHKFHHEKPSILFSGAMSRSV